MPPKEWYETYFQTAYKVQFVGEVVHVWGRTSLVLTGESATYARNRVLRRSSPWRCVNKEGNEYIRNPMKSIA